VVFQPQSVGDEKGDTARGEAIAESQRLARPLEAQPCPPLWRYIMGVVLIATKDETKAVPPAGYAYANRPWKLRVSTSEAFAYRLRP
jgi:hypothetical protein